VKRQLFLGIGVQKCATTWLYDILIDHPDLTLSKQKEVDFFSYHFGRGFQWYERQFPPSALDQLIGEISPSYFIDANVPERLHAYAPGVKLLVSLRDPIERAMSNHRHEVRLGNFCGDDLSFTAGLANNPLYVEQSRYGKHLQRWLQHFPASQLLILFQEDIDREPTAVARQVYEFLGIYTDHVSTAVQGRSNESHVYRYRFIERVRKASRNAARTLRVDGLWRAAQHMGLQSLYRRLNRRPPEAQIPRVSAAQRQQLRLLLEDDIGLVEKITGRQLPYWRQERTPEQTSHDQ